MTWKTINIDNKSQLIQQLNSYETGWIFRGHTNSSWELETTLERLLKPIGWKADLAINCETYSINLFQSRAHHYISKEQIPDSILGWIALMQHHGVPTRLLDFTESPFFALFFAFNGVPANQEESCAIWAINWRDIMKNSVAFLKQQEKGFSYTYSDILTNQDDIFERYVYGKAHNILWVTEPKIFNLRLERQKGTFILSVNIQQRIIDIISTLSPEQVHKIVIPARLTRDVFKILNDMGIDNSRLFANLEGLSTDIKMTILNELTNYFIQKTG